MYRPVIFAFPFASKLASCGLNYRPASTGLLAQNEIQKKIRKACYEMHVSE